MEDRALGDGITASWDKVSEQIWLRKERSQGPHEIPLKASTFAELLRYQRDVVAHNNEIMQGTTL